MRIFTVEAVSHFVSVCLTDNARARIEQTLHHRRGSARGSVRFEPSRAAEAGFIATNVVKVFDAAGETGEWTTRSARNFCVRVAAKSADCVAFEYVVHVRIVL